MHPALADVLEVFLVGILLVDHALLDDGTADREAVGGWRGGGFWFGFVDQGFEDCVLCIFILVWRIGER